MNVTRRTAGTVASLIGLSVIVGCAGNSELRANASGISTIGISYPIEKPSSDNPATLHLPDGRALKVSYGDSIFYVLKDDSWGHREYMLRPELEGEWLVANRFLKMDDKTASIRYLVRDVAVATISERGALKVVGPGKTSIVVGVEEDHVDIPFEVVELTIKRGYSLTEHKWLVKMTGEEPPINSGSSKTDVVQAFGLADKVEKVVLAPFDKVTLNQKNYGNESAGLLIVEQWFYNHMPRGYLEFRGYRQDILGLYRARTIGWERIDFSPIYPQFYGNK